MINTRHSLRRASSRLCSPSVSSSRPRCEISLRSHPDVFASHHLYLSAHVRWNSTNENQQPSDLPEKDAPRPRRGGGLLKVSQRYRSELQSVPSYKYIPKSKTQTNEEEASAENAIDYDDLYARSKAADQEVQQGEGKRVSRYKGLDDWAEKSLAKTPYQRLKSEFNPPSEMVYVGNLFFDLTAEDLRAHFEQAGTVLSATVVFDQRGVSKGFGYVQFENLEDSHKAINNDELSLLGGRLLVRHYARGNPPVKESENPPTNTLFVGGLPYELTDRDLQDLFEDVHEVLDIRIPVDRRSGVPRGFAHVEFENIQTAMWGKEVLARKAPYGRKLKVEFTNRLRVGMMHAERLPALWAERGVGNYRAEREKEDSLASVAHEMKLERQRSARNDRTNTEH